MKATTILGVVLIVAGLAALLVGGVSWTEKETVLDVGPIEAQVEQRETLPIPPIIGGLALAAGVVLVMVGARRRV